MRRAYVAELRRRIDVEPEPVASGSIPVDAIAWHWRTIGRVGGYFATRVAAWSGHDPHEPTYVAHPCDVNRQRTRGERVTTPGGFGQAAPPGASGPPMAELEGRLLLVDVRSIERGIVTNAGVSDGARVSLVDLGNGEAHDDAMLWGKVLVGQFTAGVKYVGRIAKGQAQPGKNPPWTWVDGTADDQAVAVRYLTHAASTSVSTQAAPAAPVAVPAQSDASASASGVTASPPWA